MEMNRGLPPASSRHRGRLTLASPLATSCVFLCLGGMTSGRLYVEMHPGLQPCARHRGRLIRELLRDQLCLSLCGRDDLREQDASETAPLLEAQERRLARKLSSLYATGYAGAFPWEDAEEGSGGDELWTAALRHHLPASSRHRRGLTRELRDRLVFLRTSWEACIKEEDDAEEMRKPCRGGACISRALHGFGPLRHSSAVMNRAQI
jgi:hypothetical protein